MRGNSWILLLKDGSSLVGGRPRGGRPFGIITSIFAIRKGRGHNRTDSCTEVFCLEMRQGVIITSILAICKGGGSFGIIALILALRYFVWI